MLAELDEEKEEEEEEEEEKGELKETRGQRDAWKHLISDDMLHPLQPLQQLISLELSHCRDVTDQGILHLAALTRLEKLVLYDVRSITDAMWLHLAHMTSLQQVWLGNSHHLTLEGVATFCSLAAVTFRAAHAARVAAAPHLVHPVPSVLFVLCCVPPVDDTPHPSPLPYPLSAYDSDLWRRCGCGDDTCPRAQE